MTLIKKLQQLFTLTGLRSDVLPGIKIAFFVVYAIFIQFRAELLSALAVGTLNPVAAYIVLAIGASLGSVVLWAISGYILDPVYDSLYGSGGPFTRRPGRMFGIFYSGYDLDQFRRCAREILAQADPIYRDPNVSIYRPTLDRLRSNNIKLYNEVVGELENSKAFRNAVLPLLFLGGWFAYGQALAPALITLVALIALVELSFRGRAEHSLKAYRWLCEKSSTVSTPKKPNKALKGAARGRAVS